MDAGRIFLGILVGAAAGALVGILFAPDKGMETRRKMIRRGDDYAQNIKDRFNEFLNNVNNAFRQEKKDNVYQKSETVMENADANPSAAI